MPVSGLMIDGIIAVALGIALTAMLASAVREIVASVFQLRQKTLVRAIHNLCGDNDDPSMSNDLASRILNHPVIRSLGPPGKAGPSYVPADQFAGALMDVLRDLCEGNGKTKPRLADLIAAAPNADLRRALTLFATDSDLCQRQFRMRVERWYDDAMDRVSGWYKRRTRAWILVFGFTVAGMANIDSLEIAQTVWGNAGQAAVGAGSVAAVPLLPLGWPASRDGFWGMVAGGVSEILTYPTKLLGFAVTAVAVMAGADFWFSLLNRFVNARASGGIPRRRTDGRHALSASDAVPAPSHTVERPESNLEATGLTRDDIEDIQRALGMTGRFLTGRLDPTTRAMIEEYQVSVGRRPTGILTPYLVERLLTVTDR